MDVETAKVVDIQLVQSNEVKNSYAMELEGLKRCFQFLKDKDIPISDLVTDRHCQVKKLMKSDHPDINHWFDVWHVAKGVYKKLEALGKSKKYKMAGEWARSISNHAYWCAASSGGNAELDKKKSILNHVTNIHEGHGDLFHSCEHGDISRKWIKPGSKVFREMEKILCGKLLLKDVGKLSPAHQTSCLESFHNVVNFFATKASHFFYIQMKARLCLAALHFNSNSCRPQATLEDGTARYRIAFPKGRKGDAVPKEIKVKQNFNYIKELMEEVVVRRLQFTTIQQAEAALFEEMDAPPPSIRCYHP
ncbi:uncharacterized protein LOC132564874 [Ylistrum balloti]|uniref:uncharacterized protein LOC132564874 n=1 Tax=Ylistrum balloti TaxID=509963 RepID=UPI002905D31A|nr:uncharacterized protein LOC132564874 [Ylistrum balloti]